MMNNGRNLTTSLSIIVLAILAAMSAEGQTGTEVQKMNFCNVVASPSDYNGKTLSVEAILWPSDHSLSLYGAACVPKEGHDVTTQAILPATWESLPNGKKLRAILKHQRPAKVELVGTFESRGGGYGPDAARFRFSITQVNAVSEVASGKSSVGK